LLSVGLQHLPMRKRGWITGMVVSIAVGLCGLAVFAACRPFLLSLYQPAKPCVTPAWEQPMLTAFRGDPIWKAAPPTFVADAPVTGYGGFSRYCDLVGSIGRNIKSTLPGTTAPPAPFCLPTCARSLARPPSGRDGQRSRKATWKIPGAACHTTDGTVVVTQVFVIAGRWQVSSLTLRSWFSRCSRLAKRFPSISDWSCPRTTNSAPAQVHDPHA
jgi:hypothetical protein